MKFHTEYLAFHTKKHREYIHITPQVEWCGLVKTARRCLSSSRLYTAPCRC
jgi:hypothetical protein